MWIAFKNLIFDYWTQPGHFPELSAPCCELLSKILSLTIEHNVDALLRSCNCVVNCFQKSYLWLLNTTLLASWCSGLTLWIAFKNLIFDYWTQLPLQRMVHNDRCELLSKILSLTIEHNEGVHNELFNWVVNCFQKSYLWLLNTTYVSKYICKFELWIAFKNLIFDYWTQQFTNVFRNIKSCELLSKILSLTIEHNRTGCHIRGLAVVNCFQKSYLWLLNTTSNECICIWSVLWIAFKNLIFDYWTQRRRYVNPVPLSCELLSKILSLTIEHNKDLSANDTHTGCELLSKILSLTIEHNI